MKHYRPRPTHTYQIYAYTLNTFAKLRLECNSNFELAATIIVYDYFNKHCIFVWVKF